MKKQKFILICEVCGKQIICDDPKDAYNLGWDYPPFMGKYGVLSPRTCDSCTIEKTLWWKITAEGSDYLNSHDLEILKRIKDEPESLYYKE